MKLHRVLQFILLPITGTLFFTGCEQKSDTDQTAVPVTSEINSNTAEEISNPPPVNITVPNDTNVIPATEPITNPPPAAILDTEGKSQNVAGTSTNPPSTPETPVAIAPAETTNAPVVSEPHMQQIYSDNAAAPTNFFAGDTTSQKNYYLRLRVGYQHGSRDDNNNTVFASAKFYAHGDALRARAGKNAWLVPDADAEFSHEVLAKPDGDTTGSEDGIKLRATFFWPWLNWTSPAFTHGNSSCPFCHSMQLSLGPTVNIGFDEILDGTDPHLDHYAGARLTINRDSFIEYTGGRTEGLDGTRQQIAAELPFYETADGDVRFMFRGLWNSGDNSSPDFFQAGVFVEMPVGIFTHPGKWRELVPFSK